MSESLMRKRIVKALSSLDAVAVENPVYPGTPDVNFIEGWVELKWLREWPALQGSIVRLDHFTPQQRIWLGRRWRKGGRAYLLLQRSDEYLLFDGATAAKSVGYVSKTELITLSIKYWSGGLNEMELSTLLLNYRNPYAPSI